VAEIFRVFKAYEYEYEYSDSNRVEYSRSPRSRRGTVASVRWLHSAYRLQCLTPIADYGHLQRIHVIVLCRQLNYSLVDSRP